MGAFSTSQGKTPATGQTSSQANTSKGRTFSWRNPVLWILVMAAVGLGLIFLGLIALGYG